MPLKFLLKSIQTITVLIAFSQFSSQGMDDPQIETNIEQFRCDLEEEYPNRKRNHSCYYYSYYCDCKFYNSREFKNRCLSHNSSRCNLDHFALRSLPSSIGLLTNLISLSLDENDLTTLPDALFSLTNLTELQLSRNPLITISKEIGNLSNLQKFILYSNHLTSLPTEFTKLKNLEELDITCDNLKHHPLLFPSHPKLKRLRLTHNYNSFTHLPWTLNRLTQLEKLSIPGDKGLDLSDEIKIDTKAYFLSENDLGILLKAYEEQEKIVFRKFIILSHWNSDGSEIANVPFEIIYHITTKLFHIH